MHTTIAQFYGEDHDRLDELLRTFQTLKHSDRPNALAAFQEFKAGLDRHIVWEEQILFPAFEAKTGHLEGPTAVMRWEHTQLRGYLEAIADKLAQDHSDTASDEAGLLSVLGPHNEKEERILYPMIDQVTGGDERAEIFAEMSRKSEPAHDQAEMNPVNPITPDITVGELVRAVPARSRIFENLGIDYCCGGKIPLAQACQKKGLDPATVVAMLAAFDGAPDHATVNPNTMTLSELCDHIEQVHHAYLREELPRLDFMTRKVAAVHGEHEPRLHGVRRVFETFQAEIAAHIQEEDEQIFPAIRQWESGEQARGQVPASLNESFGKLEAEHDKAGSALARFKELTDNYAPPDWACNTFRALYDGLAQLEENMHQHVHKENNVLFQRVRGER